MNENNNTNYFMTPEEFENIITNAEGELINRKKIIVDEKIFLDLPSFEEKFSFKLEKDNSSNINSTGLNPLDIYDSSNRTIHISKEYIGSFNNVISYIECDIYLGKNLIIVYDIERKLIIICKYIEFDRRYNYHLMNKEIVLIFRKIGLDEVKKEIEEINRYNLNHYLLNKIIKFKENNYYIFDENLNVIIKLFLNNRLKILVQKETNKNFFHLGKISGYFEYYNYKKRNSEINLNNNNNNNLIDNINDTLNNNNINNQINNIDNDINRVNNKSLNNNINLSQNIVLRRNNSNSNNENNNSISNSQRNVHQSRINQRSENRENNNQNLEIIENHENNEENNVNRNEENNINEGNNNSNMRENEIINQENNSNLIINQNAIENNINIDIIGNNNRRENLNSLNNSLNENNENIRIRGNDNSRNNERTLSNNLYDIRENQNI